MLISDGRTKRGIVLPQPSNSERHCAARFLLLGRNPMTQTSFRKRILATLAVVAVCSFSGLTTASADSRRPASPGHLVFAQTDNPAGNEIAVYDRSHDGTLAHVETVRTGGLGGRLEGAVVDPLASQGSLLYDPDHAMLFAVNAGSNSISVFTLRGTHLRLRQVLRSGGAFPVSLAQNGKLVYVLNAANAASIKGFALHGRRLDPIARSSRSLGLTPVTGPSQFVNTPGQVAFSPDGQHLLVTTKANCSSIDVFAVRHDGRPSSTFVANPSNTPVPFGIAFDRHHRLVVAEAATSALSTYRLNANSTVTPIASVTNGQAALCWVVDARGFAFGANTGSGTVTSYRPNGSGGFTVASETPVDGGPIDMAASPNGRFLYVEAGGAGAIDALRINRDGSLTSIGSVTGLDGLEGIAIA
jgi:6-phosphogluconolactonase (cycloisomerase 2 family)